MISTLWYEVRSVIDPHHMIVLIGPVVLGIRMGRCHYIFPNTIISIVLILRFRGFDGAHWHPCTRHAGVLRFRSNQVWNSFNVINKTLHPIRSDGQGGAGRDRNQTPGRVVTSRDTIILMFYGPLQRSS